jgi:hypothetical protein
MDDEQEIKSEEEEEEEEERDIVLDYNELKKSYHKSFSIP